MQNENIKNSVAIFASNYLKVAEDDVTADNYIDYLEQIISKANASAAQGIEYMPDAIYDTIIDYLRTVKPSSELLRVVWSEDDTTVEQDEDIDRFLISSPMYSILTIKDTQDKVFQDFVNRLPITYIKFHLSLKLNGHGIRAVFAYGYLVKATSRGRSTLGVDRTEQFKYFYGEYNASLAEYPLCEVRGEVLLPFSNLPEARKIKSDIKSAFTAVSALIKPSATKEEASLLHFVAYNIYADNLNFASMSEMYDFLQTHGFEVPMSATVSDKRSDLVADIPEILERMDAISQNYDYYTDGVVLSVDDLDFFRELGAADKYNHGNVALKMGRWEQNTYSGRVKEVIWKPGKSKLTPVCLIEDPDTGEEGVLTSTGNRVRNVPMYAPCYLLLVEAYVGNIINFKYGGEAGVVPCDSNGVLLTAHKSDLKPIVKSAMSGYALDYLDSDFDFDDDDDDFAHIFD